MANRPNAAYAFITEIGGEKHRLLRHHTDDVQDGHEHDTVDPQLLKASFNLLEQLKDGDAISDEEYEKVRAHLKSHARSIVVDEQPDNLNDSPTRRTKLTENDAKKIVSQQAGGPSGNDSVTSPTSEATLDDTNGNQSRRAEEALRQEGAGGSITSPKSTDIEEGKKSTENPAGTEGDKTYVQDEGSPSDVEKKGKPTGKSKKVEKGERDDKSSPGQHTEMPDDKNVGNPNDDLQADAGALKQGKEPAKKAEPELENDQTPAPKGAPVDAKAGKAQGGPQAPIKGKPGDKKAKGGPGKKGEEPPMKAQKKK